MKGPFRVTEIEDKIVIEYGRNTMMILTTGEADKLVNLLEEILYEPDERHKVLSEENSYLKQKMDELEHTNEYMKEEIELCR